MDTMGKLGIMIMIIQPPSLCLSKAIRRISIQIRTILCQDNNFPHFCVGLFLFSSALFLDLAHAVPPTTLNKISKEERMIQNYILSTGNMDGKSFTVFAEICSAKSIMSISCNFETTSKT